MPRTPRTVLASLVALLLATGAAPAVEPSLASTAVVHDLPGSAAWRAARWEGLRLPDPAATPETVARFFTQVPPTGQQNLLQRFPDVVGNLDGAPLLLRYAANQLAAARSGLSGSELGRRQVLALDPRDRGLAVEVFGDLRTATRVAVIVPGAGSDLHHLDGEGGVAAGAQALLEEAGRQWPGTRLAVIAWAGYATPVDPGLAAMEGGLARAGAARLERFLAGLSGYTSAPISLFCHSYGSVVCGMTPLPRQVRDIVVLGSPGVRARSAKELAPSARVWAALADGDPIRWLPPIRLGDYGHGTNPVDPSFGARVVVTSGASGHSAYFAPGTESLRNFARIALGDAHAVTLAGPSDTPV
ncbi:alpha/beta hydrolase [Actinopolymorpha alba]|uniref:alpha/beta hydrolase n=1 Tax=Actinopolymorpha alba TaxID=533267 RepID=UPI00038107DB|nr:alpha/beta hydrolase [Actinopolymorpha alba]